METELKKVHKVNLAIVWICTFVLAVVAFKNYGLGQQFILAVGIMAGSAVLASGIYWAKCSETLKGIVITVAIGLATLLYSIAGGGNEKSFIVSFLILAMATLYFSSKIILVYSGIYLPACIAAALVNPAYIDGPGYDTGLVVVKIIIYFFTAAGLYLATRKGERLVETSNRNVNLLQENTFALRQTANTLHHSLVQINASTSELSQNIDSISGDSNDVKKNMQAVSQNMHMLKQTLAESSQRTQENELHFNALQKQFETVRQHVDTGRNAMETFDSNITVIQENISASKIQSDRLLESTKKIADILQKIESIAMQTSILSLNASIEAAHSGGAGSGFAVIAGDIRTLSEHTAHSSQEISQILEEFVTVITQVARQITTSSDTLQAGSRNASDTTAAFSRLSQAASSMAQILAQEQENLQAFARDFSHMTQAVEVCAQAVQQTDQRVAAVAQHLNGQSAQLEEISTEIETITQVSTTLQVDAS